jgi:hypothetical protein
VKGSGCHPLLAIFGNLGAFWQFAPLDGMLFFAPSGTFLVLTTLQPVAAIIEVATSSDQR